MSKQAMNIFQQNAMNSKIQQLKIVLVTAPWHWGRMLWEEKKKIFSIGWLPFKHFQLLKSMNQTQINYIWISVWDTWYSTIPIRPYGMGVFQQQMWGKTLPNFSCFSFQPSVKLNPFHNAWAVHKEENLGCKSQRQMGMAVRENWNHRVNNIFSPHHRIQWTEHQWNANDLSKLNFPAKIYLWSPGWVLGPGTSGMAPTASEGQDCIQPVPIGNGVSTFPRYAWLPVSQLVRKFLHPDADIFSFHLLEKQKLPQSLSRMQRYKTWSKQDFIKKFSIKKTNTRGQPNNLSRKYISLE